MVTYLLLLSVGAGSAGAVVASRLSEDPSVTVLLLEAGGSEEDSFEMTVPGLAIGLQKTEYDWQYQTIPQNNSCQGLIDKVIYTIVHWLTY